MRNDRLPFLFAILALALAEVSFAQASSTDNSQLTPFALDLARKDASGQGALASGEPEVDLEATEDGGMVAAILGAKFNNDLTTITAKISGPIQKGADETELVNLTDLPGGTEADFRLSHAWSAEKWLHSKDLSTACLDINRLLSARFPDPPTEVTAKLVGIDVKSGKDRFDAYRDFWNEFRAYMIDRPNKPPNEIPPPQWAAIEGRAVAKLCSEWNSGRADDLLLGEVYQTPNTVDANKRTDKDMIENPATNRRSDACNLDNLLCRRTAKAVAVAVDKLPDPAKVEAKAREARDKAISVAKANFEAAAQEADRLKARGVSADAIEVLLGSARVERERSQREAQRVYDETLAAAQATRENAGAQAAEEDKKTVYEALAASAAKEIDQWTGLDVPFIRKRPETIGIRSFECNDIDAGKILASIESSERNRVFRYLQAAAPSQFFFTGEYKISSQDFKYIADPLAVSPTSQLVATQSQREYNHAGRLAFSAFWRGSLLTLGWTEKYEWQAKPSAQFCVPRGTGGGLVCATTASGPPEKDGKRVFDLQLKGYIAPSFALQGQVFYASEKDTLNPHLIAYFLPQNGRLRGGLDFSYVSNDPDRNDGFKLRLFIGVPFSLEP